MRHSFKLPKNNHCAATEVVKVLERFRKVAGRGGRMIIRRSKAVQSVATAAEDNFRQTWRNSFCCCYGTHRSALQGWGSLWGAAALSSVSGSSSSAWWTGAASAAAPGRWRSSARPVCPRPGPCSWGSPEPGSQSRSFCSWTAPLCDGWPSSLASSASWWQSSLSAAAPTRLRWDGASCGGLVGL